MCSVTNYKAMQPLNPILRIIIFYGEILRNDRKYMAIDGNYDVVVLS